MKNQVNKPDQVGKDLYPTALLTISLEGEILDFSPSAESFFGFDRQAMQKLNLTDIIFPEYLDEIHNSINNLLGKNLPYLQIPCRFFYSNGDILDTEMAISPYRGADGVVIGITCHICSDKKGLRSLKPEICDKELAQKYLDVAGVIMMALDVKGNITLINQKGCQILDYLEADIIGKNWFDNFLFVENLEFVKGVFSQLMTGNLSNTEYVENCVKTFSGEKRIIAWHNTLLYDENGNITGTLSSGNDITAENLAKEALKESEAKFRSLYHSVHAGVLVQSADGTIKHSNSLAQEIFGMSDKEIIGKTSNDPEWKMITEDGEPVPGDKHPSMMTLSTGKPIYNAVRGLFSGKPDKFRWLLINTLPVFHHGSGKIKEVIITFNDITGLKYAESAVRESEAQLSSIFRASPMGIGLVVDRVFKQVNEGICEMLGYSLEELINQNSRIIYPSDEEYEKVGIDKYKQIKKYGTGTVETHFKRKDGSIIDVLLSSTIIDPDDPLQGVTFTALDITGRKLAENQLKAKEQFEKLIVEISAEIINLARSTLADTINGALAKLGEFIKADRCYIFQFQDDRNYMDNTYEWCSKGTPAYIDELKDIIVDSYSVTSDYILKKKIFNISDIGQIPKSDFADRDEFEREGIKSILCVPMIFRDTVIGFMGFDTVKAKREWSEETISLLRIVGDMFAGLFERMKAERMLRNSEQRYHELFNSVLEGIAILDEDENVKYCNPAFAGIFEKASPSDLIGECIYGYIPDDQKHIVEQQVTKRRKGDSSKYELKIEPTPGLIKTVLISSSPKYDRNNKYIGSFSAVIDVSETRHLQEIAERAKRLEAAGQIAGQVAHDFNNLLGPLIAYPDFFRSELEEDHSLIPLINDMETAAEQIASINQQLLTLGRRGHYEQEPLNMNHVIGEVINQLRPETGNAKIETDLTESLMNVMGGRSQINRVISNLILNSLDATNREGNITIRSENFYADTIAGKFGRVPRGEYVKISVCDDGCGIRDDIMPKIFDPFFTTKTTDKKRGSGLGLSVVDAVIKDHMGYVDLDSTPGNTCFYLYFPITREEIADDEIEEEIKGGSEKLLVVDDDRMQQEVTCILLNKLGYEVSAVDSGDKAVNLVKTQQYDLLVLDMIMPPGIDGTETYRKALEINPDQKAIIVSGYSESERVKEALSMGAGAYIKKPLTTRSIGKAVRKELDRERKQA